MATGRRVLVSARSPEALSAIQGKLPGSIRDLAISVIHSDNEGAHRLEQAVRILASQIKQVDFRTYNSRRQELEAELVRVRKGLSEADERITEYAQMNLSAVQFRGESLMPMELSARVAAERRTHAWFKDKLDLSPRFASLFGDSDIAEARRIRKELGQDLAYAPDEFPDPADLPDTARLLAARAALAEEGKTDFMTSAGQLPFVSVSPDTVQRARLLRSWLDEAADWRAGLGSEDRWLTDAYGLLVGAKHAHPTLRDTLTSIFVEWVELADQGWAYVQRGVRVLDAEIVQEAFERAVAQLAAGQKAFGLLSFGSTAAKVKACMAEVRIDGAAPADPEAWACVRDYLNWQRRARSFLGRWSTVAATASLPHTFGDWPGAASHLIRYGEPIARMDRLHRVVGDHSEAVAVLFPWGVDSKRVVIHLEISPAREALAAALDKDGHAEAHALRGRLETLARAAVRPFHSALADVAEALGNLKTDPRELAEGWSNLLEEAARLHALRPLRQRLEAVADKVSQSGASMWADALLREAAAGDDPWTPDTWSETWEWARADGHVRMLSDRKAFEDLTALHTELEERQRKVMAELVRVRAFLGLKQGVTEKVAALHTFGLKVRQLGAGTGKSAARHRRAIREAALNAAGAVPCWILPEWRVAEQLPSALGVFDLVIIDEASQSDITCLPTILRGKKLLVVGDDKQVSPSAVGMDERTIVQLRETYLRGMDAAAFLEPTTSLYDVASICFPGGVLTLREHFQTRLVAEVGTDAIARHRIMCGNASTFQGQERDVMFLSMVACPKSVRSQVTTLIEQRINVAMSRARDRMYLVRSVAASMLQPKDLKLAVIEHFENPMRDARQALDHGVLEETEFPFEREVGAMLLDRGYRIRPQVRVGAFRIDFVVEGEGDRRLAVELDGDRYHGPDRWHEDILRQRALERVGWTFWRCWGSHWLADKQGCFDDLLAAVGRMGIEPVGADKASAKEHTEHLVVGGAQGMGEAAQAASAEVGHPVLATVNKAAPAPQEPPCDEVVEVGDTVIVRFADNNRVRRFRLTRGANNPDGGEVSVGQPIAVTLLGNGIEEEVDLVVDGKWRRVVIEKITKAA